MNNIIASVLLTAPEAAGRLRMTISWLAKERMRGEGPPFIRIGRSVRYPEGELLKWIHSQQRIRGSAADVRLRRPKTSAADG